MRPSRRTQLSEADIAEWANYVRWVRALPGREAPEPPAVVASPLAPRPASTTAIAALPRRATLAPLVIGMQPPGVDNSTWQRFRSGKMATSRTLDLHGRTAQRSHHALVSFLRSTHADGLRCVEVITGRGSGEHGGVLRRELPFWLNQPDLRPLVLAAGHPHAANTGSVRILLRRARPA